MERRERRPFNVRDVLAFAFGRTVSQPGVSLTRPGRQDDNLLRCLVANVTLLFLSSVDGRHQKCDHNS